MYVIYVFSPAQPDQPTAIELDSPAAVLEAYERVVQEQHAFRRIEVHGPNGLLFEKLGREPPTHKDMVL